MGSSLRIRAAVILFLSLFPAFVHAQHHSATVHVRLVGPTGLDLGEATVESFKCRGDASDLCGNVDLADHFQHGVGSHIRYGVYDLRARTEGFWSAESVVRVFQDDVGATLQLEIGMGRSEGGLPTFGLSGSLRNFPVAEGPIWVRLAGVYSSTVMDAEANENGEFALAGAPQGWYVLITTQGGRVLDTRPIEIPTRGPVVISLRSEGQSGTN